MSQPVVPVVVSPPVRGELIPMEGVALAPSGETSLALPAQRGPVALCPLGGSVRRRGFCQSAEKPPALAEWSRSERFAAEKAQCWELSPSRGERWSHRPRSG